VLTENGFDAGSVDVGSLRLGTEATLAGGGGATVAHDGHLEDVDGDGDLDLVVHFGGDTGLVSGDDTVTLRGSTTDGTPLVGTDAIRVVGQR
jgi:hypothetical protein